MSLALSSPSSSSLALCDRLAFPRSWAIRQERKEKGLRVWAYRLSTDTYLEEEGEEAKSLLQKIEEEKGEIQHLEAHILCFPTGFDLQVHLRFPGQSHKENLASLFETSFFGGYDSILTMPNTQPFLDKAAILRSSIKELRERFSEKNADIMKVYFSASATKNMEGKEVVDVESLKAAGASAITDDGWGVRSDTLMEKLFFLCEKYDLPFLQHAEMPGHGGHASASSFQEEHNIPLYPSRVESEMIHRDLRLLEKCKKARYHVLHVSTRESLLAIQKAKEKGLEVSCEVTPHHLFFSNVDIPSKDCPRYTNFKMNPPLFSPEDKEALQKALAGGLIDCISTDHAPHSPEEKLRPWAEAAFGTRGLLTALPCLITLMREGVLKEGRIREVYSELGRRILHGSSAPKSSGYLFVDPEKEFTLQEEDLPGISRNSCFIGTRLWGKIILRAEKAHLFSNS